MNQKDFSEIAYEQLFTLTIHYSNLIFKARLMIITIVLILWGTTLGFYKIGNIHISEQISPIFPFLGALAVSIFSLLEAVYIKLYWSVFENGKKLENDNNIFFSRKKAPVIWPFIIFYALNCIAFVIIFVIKLPVYSFVGILPFFILATTVFYIQKGDVDYKRKKV